VGCTAHKIIVSIVFAKTKPFCVEWIARHPEDQCVLLYIIDRLVIGSYSFEFVWGSHYARCQTEIPQAPQLSANIMMGSGHSAANPAIL